jgi:HAD superfamily hydrolase (TIGR01509 family)
VAGHRPTAVLFDAGGTLILQDPDEMSTRLGSPIDARAAHRAHYVAMAEFSDRRIEGQALDWDWWLERYFDLLGVAEPHLAGQRIDRGYGLWHYPLDGVVEAIEAIRRSGIRVAVVSNSDGSVTESLARAGLADLFEFVIDSHDVGVAKPDPQIFEAALERMGVVPADAWYVGDSVFHDVKGALAASMANAVLVDPYALGPEDVVKVRSISQLAF